MKIVLHDFYICIHLHAFITCRSLTWAYACQSNGIKKVTWSRGMTPPFCAYRRTLEIDQQILFVYVNCRQLVGGLWGFPHNDEARNSHQRGRDPVSTLSPGPLLSFLEIAFPDISGLYLKSNKFWLKWQSMDGNDIHQSLPLVEISVSPLW